MFIAGGAGVTPFIAIFRKLQKDGNIGANKLLFSNSTEKDIILRDEFTQMLGANFINTITQEVVKGMDHRKIDAVYLKEKAGNLGQYFYICGPDAMVEDIKLDLLAIGAANDRVIIEQF
jgi:ferredoxin-NADP reductase